MLQRPPCLFPLRRRGGVTNRLSDRFCSSSSKLRIVLKYPVKSRREDLWLRWCRFITRNLLIRILSSVSSFFFSSSRWWAVCDSSTYLDMTQFSLSSLLIDCHVMFWLFDSLVLSADCIYCSNFYKLLLRKPYWITSMVVQRFSTVSLQFSTSHPEYMSVSTTWWTGSVTTPVISVDALEESCDTISMLTTHWENKNTFVLTVFIKITNESETTQSHPALRQVRETNREI